MKRNLKILSSFILQGTDSIQGAINDFLFDEEKWVIRYIEPEFDYLPIDQKVLINTELLDNPDWEHLIIKFKLNQEELLKAPKLEKHLPFSMEYEKELNKHYKTIEYWSLPAAPIVTLFPPRPIKIPTKKVSEKEIETSLRSFNEMNGYKIVTTDGKFGHLTNLVVDTEDWQIIYAVIDSSNWFPFSKKVIIPIDHFDEISYLEKEIQIDMNTGQLKNSPEFDEEIQLNFEYEKSLYEFYTQTL